MADKPAKKGPSGPLEAPEDDDSDEYEKNLEVNWNHVWREEYESQLQE
jgi:hypothetical protein